MTNQNAADVVLAYTDAWANKDLRAAGRHLADDVVFDGPFARYESAEPLMQGLAAFASRIATGWKRIALVTEGDQVMLMYEVHLPSGAPVRIAEHFTVRDGLIRTETLTFDSLAMQAAPAGARS